MPKLIIASDLSREPKVKLTETAYTNKLDDEVTNDLKSGKLKNLKNRIKRSLTFSLSPFMSKLKLHSPSFSISSTKINNESEVLPFQQSTNYAVFIYFLFLKNISIDQNELKKQPLEKKLSKLGAKQADNVAPKRVQIESDPEKYSSSHRVFTQSYSELTLVKNTRKIVCVLF